MTTKPWRCAEHVWYRPFPETKQDPETGLPRTVCKHCGTVKPRLREPVAQPAQTPDAGLREALDAAWRELEMDALASDGRISDADVKNAIKRNRARIEAAATALTAATPTPAAEPDR